MIKIEESKSVMEKINKLLSKGGKIQLEYNHQKNAIKVLDCSPKKIEEIVLTNEK